MTAGDWADVFTVPRNFSPLANPSSSSKDLMPSANQNWLPVALLVAGAFFMENLDGTVIVTALPQMARSFGVGPVRLDIGMTAYLLALAVFIPGSGWVADRFGTRSVFGAAVAVFTLSSVLCGLSHCLGEFTAAAAFSKGLVVR